LAMNLLFAHVLAFGSCELIHVIILVRFLDHFPCCPIFFKMTT
jgi:hypothetical protein